MPINRDRLVLQSAVQSEYRDELGKFVDAFNALVLSYLPFEIANLAEVNAKADASKAVTPKTLGQHLDQQRFSTATVSQGGADANRAPRLTPQGKIDASFLPIATEQDMEAGLTDAALVTPKIAALQAAKVIAKVLKDAQSAGPKSAGAADQGKAPVLDANGKIDGSYLNPVVSLYRGAMDASAAGGGLTPTIIDGSNQHTAGDYVVVKTPGKYDLATGQPGATGEDMSPLDVLYFDGTKWARVPNPMNVAAFLHRDGSNTMQGNLVFDLGPGNAVDKTINNALLDMGQYVWPLLAMIGAVVTGAGWS